MPIYTYECENCGRFEHQQPISEPAIEHCPQCGKIVRRVITGGMGFVLKGRGALASHCEKDTPCCGRESRCDEPPCGK
jgi:putative FmdB family regulatory protein